MTDTPATETAISRQLEVPFQHGSFVLTARLVPYVEHGAVLLPTAYVAHGRRDGRVTVAPLPPRSLARDACTLSLDVRLNVLVVFECCGENGRTGAYMLSIWELQVERNLSLGG